MAHPPRRRILTINTGSSSLRLTHQSGSSPRHEKLLLMVTVLYAFLLSLLAEELEALREGCLRWGCHRTGKRSRKVATPLYRLRAALSRLLIAYPASPVAPSLRSG